MKRTSLLDPVRNSRGMLTAEFIFSLVLCAGICIVLFSLNFTLSMAEVAQYIVYSSARAHAAGHIDQDKQEQMAKEKYAELIANPVLKPLFSTAGTNWFVLSETPDVRGGGPSQKSFDDIYPAHSSDQRVPQVGVRINFQPKLLNVKIAFLGSTAEDDQGYSAHVAALLIREPTQKECWDLQVRQRYSAILNLDSRFKQLGASGQNKYIPTEDNGC